MPRKRLQSQKKGAGLGYALPLAESLQNQPIREPSGTGVEVRASLRMEGVWERGIGISSQEVREEALMFSHSAFTLQ